MEVYIICDYSRDIHKHYYGQAATKILGYTYAGMHGAGLSNECYRLLYIGYTGMA